jgi:hypothetical protein
MNKVSLKNRSIKSSKKKSANKHFRYSPTLQDIDDIFLGQTISEYIDKSLNSKDTSKYKQTITVSPNTKTINIKKFNTTNIINSKSNQSSNNNIVSSSLSYKQNIPSIDKNIENKTINNDKIVKTIKNKNIIKSPTTLPTNSYNEIKYNKDNKIKLSEYSNNFNQNKIYEYYPVKKYSHNNKFKINLNNNETKKHKIKKEVNIDKHIQKINNNDNKNYKKILQNDEITIERYNKTLKETENIDKNNNLSRKIRLYTNLENFEKLTNIFDPYVYSKFKDNLKYYNNLPDFYDKYILSIITDGIIIK